MKTRSGGRSDEIDPGDAPRSVRKRRSRLKMPRRNAHADAAPSENKALDDGQAQELQVHSTHSFRATMIQWLLDANHPETVIAKKTGHKDMKSLKS